MIHNIQRLLYLCHVKNDLNRKRRRFYYYMYEGAPQYKAAEHMKKTKHISVKEAMIGYSKAQQDMKAMTKEMRAMRIEMGVRIVWGDSGNIHHVVFQGGRIMSPAFRDYYEAELFEMAMFKR